MRRDIIVIGASSGGVNALKELFSKLPPKLPVTIFVVLHLWEHGMSMLNEILNQHHTLPVSQAKDGEVIKYKRIYMAPPDKHLIISKTKLQLTDGPREQGARPAVDVLFRSAAEHYGPRVIGVILTGLLSDGTKGLGVVKDKGGLAIVQDPKDAQFPDMPTSAIQNVQVDHILPLRKIAPILVRLVGSGQPVRTER